MNLNDLPPAARLAALIEAGRAANPDLRKNNHPESIKLLNVKQHTACAIGFALLGAGVSRKDVVDMGINTEVAAKRLGLPRDLCGHTAFFNDARASSLDEVCQSLREGELSKVTA